MAETIFDTVHLGYYGEFACPPAAFEGVIVQDVTSRTSGVTFGFRLIQGKICGSKDSEYLTGRSMQYQCCRIRGKNLYFCYHAVSFLI